MLETLSEIVTNTYYSGGLVELNSVHRLTLAIRVCFNETLHLMNKTKACHFAEVNSVHSLVAYLSSFHFHMSFGKAKLMTRYCCLFAHQCSSSSWMVYCTVAFTWIMAAAINLTVSFPTTAVVNGSCWFWSFWPSNAVQMTYSVLYFIFYFFNLVVIFIYCYSHMFVMVRRQARVMQGHQQQGHAANQTSSSLSQSQQKMQASVLKTVISLTAFFVVCWAPNNVYYLLHNVVQNVPLDQPVYYVTR